MLFPGGLFWMAFFFLGANPPCADGPPLPARGKSERSRWSRGATLRPSTARRIPYTLYAGHSRQADGLVIQFRRRWGRLGRGPRPPPFPWRRWNRTARKGDCQPRPLGSLPEPPHPSDTSPDCACVGAHYSPKHASCINVCITLVQC